MKKRERAYTKKIQELIEKSGRLQDDSVQAVFDLLESTRSEIGSRLIETDWDAYHVGQMKDAITRAMDRFTGRYKSMQGEALSNMWEAGQDMVAAPLQAAGVSVVAPEISMAALDIMQGYSGDLITGLSADALKKVNGEVALGVLGAKQPHEVMKAIGRNLKDKSVFKSISARAEAITRTEMATVHSLAREARLQATVARNPEITWIKIWHSSGKAHPRPHHARLNGVGATMDKDFLGFIPYPHAPGLPASEKVNCGCFHTLSADWDVMTKDFDPIPYQERATYKQAAEG